MNLILRRYFSTDQGTVGALLKGGRIICYVLELPWRDNKSNLSCIPTGSYDVRYLARSGSGKYKDVWHVTGVPGRSGILFHAGNYAGRTPEYKTHSHGCILTASRFAYFPTGKGKRQLAGANSRHALLKMRREIGHNGFALTIEDAWK